MANETRDQRRAAARAEREAAERQAAQAKQRKRRLAQLLGVLAVAAVVVVAVVLVVGHDSGSDKAPTKQAGDTLNGQTAINSRLAGIPQSGITLGKSDAPVTVVEFGDLQCPVCAAFSTQLMPAIIDGYVKPGKIKVEYRDIHFIGADSVTLGKLAESAGRQDRLWNVAELIWANQGTENSGYATNAFLEKIANAVPGLDAAKALQGMSSATVTSQLDAATKLAKQYGVDATPTFLVGKSGGQMQIVDASGLGAALQKYAGAPAGGASTS
jgi:protein-disulfide isomerase